MKTWKLIVCALVLAPVLAFAGKPYFVNPNEPHGVVTGIINLPAKELFSVDITEVNGRRTSRKEGIWLKPGTYRIHATNAKIDLRRTAALGRDIRPRTSIREAMTIELEVEQGKTYYLALDTSSHNRADWKLVNWMVE